MASQPSFRAVAHVRRPRLSDTITDQIEDLIATGKLKPGDRMPAERDLAQQLDVSRPSLREALLILESRGLLQARRGGGFNVTDVTAPTITDPPHPAQPPGPITGRIDCAAVTFRYPGADRPVLDGVSLHAQPGDTVAIVGRTGSGKTYAFLLPLVARLATSGTRRAPNRPRALILAPTRELVTRSRPRWRPTTTVRGCRTW